MREAYRSLRDTDADVAIGVLSERWRRTAGAGLVTGRQQLQHAGETCSSDEGSGSTGRVRCTGDRHRETLATLKYTSLHKAGTSQCAYYSSHGLLLSPTVRYDAKTQVHGIWSITGLGTSYATRPYDDDMRDDVR
ncbi:hypothetical protein PSPO01_05417 [Paraphaeosphaeria sporulosa]